jgi:hypothetical protein
MALLILNNCLKTINKSFILFVIKSWPQIQNLTIVRAERDIFFKFKQNVRVWQNKNFSDVCPTLMFVFSDVWHSDVFPLWRLPLWRLSLWRLSTLTFVSLTFFLVPPLICMIRRRPLIGFTQSQWRCVLYPIRDWFEFTQNRTSR